MHELSLLQKIVACVEDACEQNGVKHVAAVELEVGELTGMLPFFLKQYFKPFTETNPLFAGAGLVVDTVPERLRCRACGKVFPSASIRAQCPVCCSLGTEVVSGREIIVRNIVTETIGEGTDGLE